jgi:IclR family acetate operon transcriptional repressor
MEAGIERAPAQERTGAPTGSQAIERALAVLDCFMTPDKPELGVTEIARRLGLSPSTVHRIVRALMAAGYLDQNPRTEQYYLGRSAVLLGQVAQRAVGLDAALPVLEDLARRTGESVNFGVLDGDAGIVTLRIDTKHPLRFDQPVGTRVGLHCSSMGKALLAFHPDGPGASRRLGKLARHTSHTIVSREALERELAAIRERGYSLDEQEAQLGVRCIGAPVLDHAGRAHAAIAVQIPTVRMPREELPKLAPFVVEAAGRIAALISPERKL